MDTSHEDGLGFVTTGGGNSPVASSGSSDAGSVVAGGSDDSVMTNGADGTSSTTSGDNGVNASMDVGGSEGGAASGTVSNPTVVNSGDLSVTNSADSIKSPDNHIDMAQNQTDSNVNAAINSNVGRVTDSSLGGLVNTNAQADFSASGMVSQNMDGTITQNLDGTGFSSFSNTGSEGNGNFGSNRENGGNVGGIIGGSTNRITGRFVGRNIRRPMGGATYGAPDGGGGETVSEATNLAANGNSGGKSAVIGNSTMAVETSVGGVASNQQGKKKTGLIIGIVVAAVCVIVGVILFLTVGLSALDPKTGDNIKAKNYQEAFNIYANYFLFGERSKMVVDWEAARADDFVSYFRKVIDNPFGVEGADGAQASPSSIIAKMNEYFSVFQKMYTEQENNTNAIAYVDEYGRTLKLVFLNYDTGLPTRESVLASYLEGGRKVADGMIQDVAKKYETVGVLFGDDINNLVSRYGESQLALIEEYNKMGCVSGGGIDYNCVSSNDNEVSRRYSLDSSETLDEYLSDITGSYNDLRRKLSIIGDGINTEWGTSPNSKGEMNS